MDTSTPSRMFSDLENLEALENVGCREFKNNLKGQGEVLDSQKMVKVREQLNNFSEVLSHRRVTLFFRILKFSCIQGGTQVGVQGRTLSSYRASIEPFTKRHKLSHNGGFPMFEVLF